MLLRYSLYSFLLISLFSCSKKQEEKPNIIYILADDLGYGDLGCYGQKIIRTPNLDKLAASGMLFTDHYAGSSVCAPSRATLMTGINTGHNRIRGNYETGPMGFGAGRELSDESVTVAEVLREQGYTNAIIGKWGMGMNGTTGEPIKQGFDYSYGYLNQGHAHFQFPSFLFRNGERIEIPENKNLSNKLFSNDLFTEESLKFVEEKKDTPFFLYLAYTTPHAEMLLPQSSTFESYKGLVDEKPFIQKGEADTTDNNQGAYRSQMYPAAAYAAQVTHLDSCVGVLLNKIKELGLEQNTIVMFSSDNGPHAEGGANPSYFKSSGELRGQKRDLYEGGIRVPFMVKWPARIKPQSVTDHISAFWDILPTLANIAGVEKLQTETDGISFLPTLIGEENRQTKHAYLYWEFHENPTTNQAIRKNQWKAVRMDPDGELELYNLNEDLAETNNIAGEHPEVVREMKTLFQKARTPDDFWKMKRKK